ncbi:MAG: hypothetical protein J6T10_27860 [Methanobrevibacter sp.]|nr:hypothetical protein [Methanobrevibacter sp.]
MNEYIKYLTRQAMQNRSGSRPKQLSDNYYIVTQEELNLLSKLLVKHSIQKVNIKIIYVYGNYSDESYYYQIVIE